MAKRKDSAALFDLIARGKSERGEQRLAVPEWFGKAAPAGTAPATGPAAAPPLPEPEAASAFPQAKPERMLWSDGGRVKLSLGYVTFATAVMGLVVLVGVAFWLGMVTARPGPTAQPSPGPTGGPPYRPGAAEPNTVPPPPPVAGERVFGKYYLIIDRMRGMSEQDHLDAEAIAGYCNRSGFPATVEQLGGRYIVWSLTAYDSPSSPEAMDFARKIEDLGRRYTPPAGRNKYTFSQHSGSRLDPSYARLKQ